MARAPAVFAEGMVAGALGVLAGPVPNGQRWYVTRLDCCNTSGSQDVDVVLYLNTDGNYRRWKGARLDRDGGHCEAIDDKAVALEAGDMIMASASLGNVVTFYCAGIRET